MHPASRTAYNDPLRTARKQTVATCHNGHRLWRRLSSFRHGLRSLVRAPSVFPEQDSTWNFTVCTRFSNRRAIALLACLPQAPPALEFRAQQRVRIGIRALRRAASLAPGKRTKKNQKKKRSGRGNAPGSIDLSCICTAGQHPRQIIVRRRRHDAPRGFSPAGHRHPAAPRRHRRACPTTTCPASRPPCRCARRMRIHGVDRDAPRSLCKQLAVRFPSAPCRSRWSSARSDSGAPERRRSSLRPMPGRHRNAWRACESVCRCAVDNQDDVPRSTALRRRTVVDDRHHLKPRWTDRRSSRSASAPDSLKATPSHPARHGRSWRAAHDPFDGCGFE